MDQTTNQVTPAAPIQEQPSDSEANGHTPEQQQQDQHHKQHEGENHIEQSAHLTPHEEAQSAAEHVNASQEARASENKEDPKGEQNSKTEGNEAAAAAGEEEEAVISILNFNAESAKEPILTSPRSLQACRMLGIIPDTLVKKKDEDIYRPLKYKSQLNEEGIQTLVMNAEKRRKQKVDSVISLRNRIIEGDLSKEDRRFISLDSELNSKQQLQNSQQHSKSLQEPEQTHQQTLPNHSQSKFDGGASRYSNKAFDPQNSYTSWDMHANRMEKSRNDQKRKIEGMIVQDLRMSDLAQMSELKKQSVQHLLARRDQYFMNLRQMEREQLVDQKRQQHYNQVLRENQEKEDKYLLKQSHTMKSLTNFRQVSQQIRTEQSETKESKQVMARQHILMKEELRKQMIQKSYEERSSKFERNKKFFEQFQENNKKQFSMMQKQEEKAEAEKSKPLPKKEKQLTEGGASETVNETQSTPKASKLQQPSSEAAPQEDLSNLKLKELKDQYERLKRIQTAKSISASMYEKKNQERIEKANEIESRHHATSVLKKQITQQNADNKRIKEEEIRLRKARIILEEEEKAHQKFILRQHASTTKINTFLKDKQQFYQSRKSKNLIKGINALDNMLRLENQQEHIRIAMTEKNEKHRAMLIAKEEEEIANRKKQEHAYTKMKIERQHLQEDLDRKFQKNKKIDIAAISSKIGVQLNSEEALLSQSLYENDGMRQSKLNATNSPSKFSSIHQESKQNNNNSKFSSVHQQEGHSEQH